MALLNKGTLEIIKEFMISIGVAAWFEQHGKEVVKKGVERITESVRNDLFVFIMAMSDDAARESILRRHKVCKGKPGAEDRFVKLLSRLYLTVKDDPSKHWIFTALGHLNDEDFNQALYFFENDLVKQTLDKIKGAFKNLAATVRETIEEADEKGKNFFDQFLKEEV